MRSPSRTARFGLAGSPFTSTLPPSQARFASERVLNRQATSSQTSRRRESFTLLRSHFSVGVQVQVQALGGRGEPRTPNPEPRTPNRTSNPEPEDELRSEHSEV